MQRFVAACLILALAPSPVIAQVPQRPVLVDQPRPVAMPTVVTEATEEINRLHRQSIEIEQKKVNESKERAEQLKALEATYTELTPTTGATISELNGKLDALEKRMKALEEAAREAELATLDLDRIKYLTGHEALKVIINKLAALDFGTRFGDVMSQLERRSNPTSYQGFKNAVGVIQKNLGPNALTLPQSNNAGLLSNPYVAVAYSIGSLLFSRLRSPERAEKYQVLMCTLDYSTRTDSQRALVDSRLTDLLKDVTNMRAAAISLFDDYAKLVEFQGGYEEWNAARLKRGIDPIQASTTTFFAKLRQLEQEAQPKIQEIRYNFERVKTQIDAYEQLLGEVDTFFAALEDAAKIEPDPLCRTVLADSEFKQFDVATKVEQLKASFKNADFHVSPEAKGVLYKQ